MPFLSEPVISLKRENIPPFNFVQSTALFDQSEPRKFAFTPLVSTPTMYHEIRSTIISDVLAPVEENNFYLVTPARIFPTRRSKLCRG